jgi:glutathione S-transferase
MSLLPIIPADYSLVVATGTLGVYSLLTFQSINVSKARKAANVQYPSPYAENSVAERDVKAKKFSKSISTLHEVSTFCGLAVHTLSHV